MTDFTNLKSIKVAKEFFQNNANVVNVDCNNVDFTNNDAEEAFRECSELVTVRNLPNTLTKMKTTFRNCQKMINPPVMPTSVKDMTYCFYDCHGMKTAPDLSHCNNVTSVYRCFAYNYELEETPVIPDSVTNMANVCQGCKKITSFPNIPNGVTDLSYAFDQCLSVASCNRTIPSQITKMNHTFSRCTALKGKIFIEAEGITDATDCFADTALEKKVYIPFQNAGVDTTTYTSFTAAGYDTLGTTNGVILIDLNSYVPPVYYDFPDDQGEVGTFSWTNDMTVAKNVELGETTVTTTGVSCGSNMSISGTTVSHTATIGQAPDSDSYLDFIFNVDDGMFKPQSLSFDICKNGTNGGSVLVTMAFDTLENEEVEVCNLPTIARNSEDPSYTHAEVDLTAVGMKAAVGTATIRFYLYNQNSGKTFSLSNVTVSGLFRVNSGPTSFV